MQVLYIEDDATNRVVLREMLASAGIALAEAEDAQTGLQLIQRGRYDLVIMDLRMPGMSGLTAIRQIRMRETAGTRTPILVVSAELTAGTREMCEAAGAEHFLCKPITMNDLFREIGAALASSKAVVLN